MTASLAWLDHDGAAHERSLRLLALFKEKESRDELGVGGIRDAIADRLFPGTSTIQTRLRYMCFIPWIYAGLEERRESAQTISAKAREAEARLMAELMRTEKTGVIGREAGAALKRLPSSIYWAGLGEWGLRRYPGSQRAYHLDFDRIHALRTSRRRRDDGEWLDERSHETWYAHLVALKPQDFPSGVNFVLTKQEAELLAESLQHHQRESLLAWLAARVAKTVDAVVCEYPWRHPNFETFLPTHRNCLHQARVFSFLHRGAALLYNLQLAELRLEMFASDGEDSAGLAKTYRDELLAWTSDPEFQDLAAWSPSSLWPEVMGHGHAIHPATQAFVEQWTDVARREGEGVADSNTARALVRRREMTLKGGHSRFVNRKALEQWGGRAGTARLNYRWLTARTFLNDLWEALHS